MTPQCCAEHRESVMDPATTNVTAGSASNAIPMMTVFVTHRASQRVVPVDISSTATVADLSRAFSKQMEETLSFYSIVFQGRTLDIAALLSDEGLGSENAVEAVVSGEDLSGIQTLNDSFSVETVNVFLSLLRRLPPEQEAYLSWDLPDGQLSTKAIYKDLGRSGQIRYREISVQSIMSWPDKVIGNRIGPKVNWKQFGLFVHLMESKD